MSLMILYFKNWIKWLVFLFNDFFCFLNFRVKEAAFNCYQAYLLHLLDINWQVSEIT